MSRREYIAKFLGDLAKIIFATAIITQIIEEKTEYLVLLLGLFTFLGLFILSLLILPKEE